MRYAIFICVAVIVVSLAVFQAGCSRQSNGEEHKHVGAATEQATGSGQEPDGENRNAPQETAK